MRKISYGIGLLCAVFLLVFGFYASYRLFPGEEEKTGDSVEAENPMEPGYQIREEEGKLNVYTEEGELYETTEITWESLPRNIQEQVREGYVIRGKRALYGFLENYSS